MLQGESKIAFWRNDPRPPYLWIESTPNSELKNDQLPKTRLKNGEREPRARILMGIVVPVSAETHLCCAARSLPKTSFRKTPIECLFWQCSRMRIPLVADGQNSDLKKGKPLNHDPG